MLNTCTCNRIGEHCPNAGCGSISKAPLKQRTAIMARQTGLDVRYYSCRKCGVEFGWLNGCVYDGECYAPKKVRIVAAPQSLEREVKDLNEAIQFIHSRGGIVEFPNGIRDPSEKPPTIVEPKAPIESEPELVIKKIESEEPFSLDELEKGAKK